MEYICNQSHNCTYEPCNHNKPHKGQGAGCEIGIGGVPAKCYEGKLVSICVPVKNGKYKTQKRVWCDNPKCNGGWWEETEHLI